MNNNFMLCVGMLTAGLASQTIAEAGTPKPVQRAAGGNVAGGGCDSQPATYRSPMAQRRAVNDPAGACTCPKGVCTQAGCSTACPNGQCYQNARFGAAGADCYGPNCPPADTRRSYPANGGSRYNILPVRKDAPLRTNPYSTQRRYDANQPRYNANWDNSRRPLRSNAAPTSTSPFFN